MKVLFLVAVASMAITASATAEVTQPTTLVHDGATLSVSYETRTKTRLRQGGLGPRLAATCLWNSEVSVERTLTDAAAHRVEALTRTIGETKSAEGLRLGYCTDVQPHQIGVFQGNPDKMQAFLAETSEADRQNLQTELASLGSVKRSVLR